MTKKKLPQSQNVPHEATGEPSLSHSSATSEQEEQKRVVIAASYQQTQFSGPLPPPSILREYNEVDPTFAERIMTMTEKQSDHRRSLEQLAITSEIRRSWAGLCCGFLIALAGLAVSAYLGSIGQSAAASIIGGSTLVGLAGVFVYGTISRKQERQQKAETLAKRS